MRTTSGVAPGSGRLAEAGPRQAIRSDGRRLARQAVAPPGQADGADTDDRGLRVRPGHRVGIRRVGQLRPTSSGKSINLREKKLFFFLLNSEKAENAKNNVRVPRETVVSPLDEITSKS